MFDLKLTSSEISDSTCAVSWCVDEETLKYLSDNQINDPQVVLVVAPEGRCYHSSKEYRKVVPLKDLMAYVEFRAGGPNKIWGFISFYSNKNDTRDSFLSRKNGDFKTNILSTDGSEYAYDFREDYSNSNKLLVSQPQSVVIPTDVFASEPWEWEKTWVNHFFREKPIDQCDFRRRRFFAYSIQPFIVLGNLFIRFLFVLTALLIGTRNLSLNPLFSPLSTDMQDAANVCTGGSIFIRHCKEDDIYAWIPRPLELVWYLIKSYWALPFMPPILFLTVLMIFCHIWNYFIVLGAVVGFITGIAVVITYFASDMYNETLAWFNMILDRKEEAPWYLDQNEIDLLTCKPDRAGFNFKNLPARKKTVYLRFQDLKSRVCKPFSA